MKLEYSEIQQAAAQWEFRTQAFIDGKLVDAQSAETFTTKNPATGKPLAETNLCVEEHGAPVTGELQTELVKR